MSALTIADLRAMRSTSFGTVLESLNKKSEYSKDDENFWKLEKDKAGNGSAVIRFLTAHAGETMPWVEIFSHGFQGPGGKWLIDTCPTTVKADCPICEAQRPLWAGTEADKALAKNRKRRTHFISNILVVSDPAHPENNGKIFYFKFGKKIFEKITQKMQPSFADDEPVDVIDLFEGANFKLRMQQVEGYPNYDQSSFSDKSPVAKTDESIVAIANSTRSLNELVSPSKIKSYAELKTKMDQVLNGVGSAKAEEIVEKMKTEPVKAAKKIDAPKAVESTPISEDDDMEAYFKSLAET